MPVNTSRSGFWSMYMHQNHYTWSLLYGIKTLPKLQNRGDRSTSFLFPSPHPLGVFNASFLLPLYGTTHICLLPRRCFFSEYVATDMQWLAVDSRRLQCWVTAVSGTLTVSLSCQRHVHNDLHLIICFRSRRSVITVAVRVNIIYVA